MSTAADSATATAAVVVLPTRRGLTALENGIVGGISGTIEVLIQQPTVAWKNALQEKRPFSANPVFLYRGVGINATSIAPITAVQFSVNGVLSNALLAYNKANGGPPPETPLKPYPETLPCVLCSIGYCVGAWWFLFFRAMWDFSDL